MKRCPPMGTGALARASVVTYLLERGVKHLHDGIIVPVFEKIRLEYSYLTPGGAFESVRLARDINTSPFYRVQLIIRVHSLTISSGQSFSFALVNTLPSDVDPREFSDPTAGGFLTVGISGGSPPTPPTIVSGSATDPGAFLKLTMTATQGTVGGAAMYGEFSGVLVLRRP